MLKADFIPVWESVAPVRTVTFNLGEGRKLKGSISGEIAIYFCDTDGKVFDILPALQSPAATLIAMKEAKRFYGELEKAVKKANNEKEKIFDGLEKLDSKEVKRAKGKPETQYVRGELSPKYGLIVGIPDNADHIYTYEDMNDRLSGYFQREINHMVKGYHKKRMLKIAADRYDEYKKNGKRIFKNPEQFDAKKLFPESALGESLRENYINSSTDKATRDLRIMALSKTIAAGPTRKERFLDSAITVVEPGGRGYYQWKIGQGFHGVWHSANDGSGKFEIRSLEQMLMTPDQWKKALFEGILKQELKGGEVEYNSDSLKAINLFEE